jgi:hypothetical protein
MSSRDWDSLGKRNMGEIIFHNKKNSSSDKVGMPQLISGGDLDGDLYYICWDTDIVGRIDKTREFEIEKDDKETKLKNVSLNFNEQFDSNNWLLAAQNHMISNERKTEKRNVGIIYNEMEKLFKSSQPNLLNKDYKLLAAAYKHSIDGQKHGGDLDLPEYLKKKLQLF